MDPTPLNLEQLLHVPHVHPYGGIDVCPKENLAAFSWNRTGQWEIYELALEGEGPPRLVTSGPGAKFAPRYSPDGSRLAYALDEDGSESYDIWAFDRSTGRHTNLTPDSPDAIQPSISWSPDGSEIALISNRSGTFDTYLMPSSGGSLRLLHSSPEPHGEVDWSPDGRRLAVTVEGKGQDIWTYILPVHGGEAGLIGGAETPLHAKDARWAPDGSRLAFASNTQGDYDIGLYNPETQEVTWAAQGPGDQENPCWSPDGKRLAYLHAAGPKNQIVVLDLLSGEILQYQEQIGVHHAPHFTPDGSGLLFVFDSPQQPDDLWLLSPDQGKFRQLTHSLPGHLEDLPPVRAEEVAYPSLDGVMVPALLFRSAAVQAPAPAVVLIHGGPNWLYQFTWDPTILHMASRGWTVLAPNYRGSTGYGREWQLASRFDMGGVDTRDVTAGADYLVREGLALPGRIAASGRSHGGYLTMTCLTQYPDRWAAGSAVVPFLNWFTAHDSSREDLQYWDLENFGDPQQDYDLWYERSPFFFLNRIQAPVQLICGANDPRCPAGESIAARDALRALGKTVDFALFPDEGHTFLKIENVVRAEKLRAAFLAQALAP